MPREYVARFDDLGLTITFPVDDTDVCRSCGFPDCQCDRLYDEYKDRQLEDEHDFYTYHGDYDPS